jgi:hypothetical protein
MTIWDSEEDAHIHADWIKHVKRCGKLKKWDANTMFESAVVQLCGRASESFEAAEGTIHTLEKLAAHLKLVFDPPNAISYFSEKLINLRLKRNESLKAYNARFRTLLRRLREVCTDAFADTTLLTFYKKSLTTEIRKEINDFDQKL